MLVEVTTDYGVGFYNVKHVRINWCTLVLDCHRYFDYHGEYVDDDDDEVIELDDTISITAYIGHECSNGTMHLAADAEILLVPLLNNVNTDIIPLFIGYELVGEQKLASAKKDYHGTC